MTHGNKMPQISIFPDNPFSTSQLITCMHAWIDKNGEADTGILVLVQLLVGSPMPDRSRGRSQMKRDTLVLQVGG
jgi:hypothetical protein